MKKSIFILFFISAVFLFNTCALEIANVIGPDGGYVFYDKGSYTYGWRYIQCSSYDFSSLNVDDFRKPDGNVDKESFVKATLKLCMENITEWHKFGWEIPTKAHLTKMLECFSYGLTRFSSNYYYIAVDDLYDAGRSWICTPNDTSDHSTGDGVKNTGDFCTECGKAASSFVEGDDPPDPNRLKDPANWKVVILHKNFNDAANGKVEEITLSDFSESATIRVRAIRRF